MGQCASVTQYAIESAFTKPDPTTSPVETEPPISRLKIIHPIGPGLERFSPRRRKTQEAITTPPPPKERILAAAGKNVEKILKTDHDLMDLSAVQEEATEVGGYDSSKCFLAAEEEEALSHDVATTTTMETEPAEPAAAQTAIRSGQPADPITEDGRTNGSPKCSASSNEEEEEAALSYNVGTTTTTMEVVRPNNCHSSSNHKPQTRRLSMEQCVPRRMSGVHVNATAAMERIPRRMSAGMGSKHHQSIGPVPLLAGAPQLQRPYHNIERHAPAPAVLPRLGSIRKPGGLKKENSWFVLGYDSTSSSQHYRNMGYYHRSDESIGQDSWSGLTIPSAYKVPGDGADSIFDCSFATCTTRMSSGDDMDEIDDDLLSIGNNDGKEEEDKEEEKVPLDLGYNSSSSNTITEGPAVPATTAMEVRPNNCHSSSHHKPQRRLSMERAPRRMSGVHVNATAAMERIPRRMSAGMGSKHHQSIGPVPLLAGAPQLQRPYHNIERHAPAPAVLPRLGSIRKPGLKKENSWFVLGYDSTSSSQHYRNMGYYQSSESIGQDSWSGLTIPSAYKVPGDGADSIFDCSFATCTTRMSSGDMDIDDDLLSIGNNDGKEEEEEEEKVPLDLEYHDSSSSNTTTEGPAAVPAMSRNRNLERAKSLSNLMNQQPTSRRKATRRLSQDYYERREHIPVVLLGQLA